MVNSKYIISINPKTKIIVNKFINTIDIQRTKKLGRKTYCSYVDTREIEYKKATIDEYDNAKIGKEYGI